VSEDDYDLRHDLQRWRDSPRIFSKKLYERTFAFRRIFAGKLSRPGMAFQPCRNEELFQPALAAEMPLTSMIPQG
jgi:hypothetical protein